MTVKVEGLLGRPLGLARQVLERPGVRQWLGFLGWAGCGFLGAAASLRGSPQPLVLGLVLSRKGSAALLAAAGGILGYRWFWGQAGEVGFWWLVLGAALCLWSGKRHLSICSAVIVGAVGLWFQLRRGVAIPPEILALQCAVGAGAAWVFQRRDRIGRWLQCAAGTLALGQVVPVPWLGLGFAAGAALAVGASFPAAALAGLGLDLAGITSLPMAAAMSIAWLGRLLPVNRSLRPLIPGFSVFAVMLATGRWELTILPSFFLGGALGLTLPRDAPGQPRQGTTGPAQVRLELAAGLMGQFRRVLVNLPPPDIDREALLRQARDRACGGCSYRGQCLERHRLTVSALADPRSVPCRKGARLRRELCRSRDQLKLLTADHRRREEYRWALAHQYRVISSLLRQLSDDLSQGSREGCCRYGVTIGVRTRGRGDRWAAFPAGKGRYYVLLCDGMGTGEGAGAYSRRALRLLRRMLAARMPPRQAMKSMNDLLVLAGRPGAVTMDIVELRLDTGFAMLYKWGAAPSWLIREGTAEKIGTATPPPGLSALDARLWSARLSLRRGETLILISDGVDGEEVPRQVYNAPDAPPGELAEMLLEGRPRERADDATAAVLRLYPGNLATS